MPSPSPAKALLIACEKYPKGEDVAPELKGTLESARACYQWLTKDKGLTPADIYVCCDAKLVAGHPADRSFASTRAGIGEAITDLVERHRGKVTELYVFFSGHGLGYEQSPQQRGLDLLLATDYRSRKKSGAAAINIGELQSQLEIWLGGDDHYYFLDACRTVLKAGEIVPAGLGMALDPANAGDPTTYALFSTKFGEAATVNAKFPTALLQGLRGEGRAKTRVKKTWWVQFDRLQKHVDSLVDTPTDSMKIGSHEGLIAKLEKSFETKLTVRVDGAGAGTDLVLSVESNGLEQPFPFKGPAFEKKLPPNDAGYDFKLLFNGQPLRRLSPVDDDALDLFEPVELRFQMPMAVGAPPPRDLGLESTATPSRGPRAPAPAPTPPLRNSSRVRQAIANRVPSQDGGRTVDFSESLGPITLQHTALWLSILGASRIVNDSGMYSKLRDMPLARFDNLQKDESAIYVLAGLERSSEAWLSVSRTAKPDWEPIAPLSGFAGVVHRHLTLQPGSQLVSVALPGHVPVTFASHALPNRVILFVLTENAKGKLEAWQMLLPLYSLSQYLPPRVSERARQEGLRLVRYLVLQQDRFARRESLAAVTDRERQDLQALLYGKWLDPLLALTAIFEMARRGGNANEMSEAVQNLRRYFGELPDVAAAEQIFAPRKDRAVPPGFPLLRESLLRWPKLMEQLPLPAGLLDYGSIWTSWVGAVDGPPKMKKI